MPKGFPTSMLGMIVSGDLGGYTIYTDRFMRKVTYLKAPPQKPPTEWQTLLRGRFRDAQAQYMALSPADRASWEDLANRSGLCMTGQNLLIHVAMKHSFGLLNTLIHQTGVSVNAPSAV